MSAFVDPDSVMYGCMVLFKMYNASQMSSSKDLDCHIQEWHGKCGESDRYRWYSTFKNHFGVEKYLMFLTFKKFRDSFIRFRFGINSLKTNNLFFDTETMCPFCAQASEN